MSFFGSAFSCLGKGKVHPNRKFTVESAIDTEELQNQLMQKVKIDPEDMKVAYELNRGGIVVKTSEGLIQFGMPPETIKDSMRLGQQPPTTYVIYGEMFDRIKGINVAEFEFPAYFNFFVKKTQVKLLTTKELKSRIQKVFEETLLGPKETDYRIKDDFPAGTSPDNFPRFKEEGEGLDSFRKSIKIETLLSFETFTAQGKDEAILEFGGMGESKTKNVTISVRLSVDGKAPEETGENGKREVIELGGGIDYSSKYFELVDKAYPGRVIRIPLKVKLRNDEYDIEMKPFDVPEFGVTMLGASHGFDKVGRTTGFVLWMNRKGIMVDPPPDSNRMLEKLGIPPSAIDCLILTHCHADHDAGTFQKICASQRVMLYTTKTIQDSFLRKYAAITNFASTFLGKLFTFHEVEIGQPIYIHENTFGYEENFGSAIGSIQFFYSLHVIPCIGFTASYNGKSILYSADTHTNPELIQRMFQDGAIGEGRKTTLKNFPKLMRKQTVVLHEMGVPPIHTPKEILMDLPSDLKAKLFVVHASRQAVGDDGLRPLCECDTIRIRGTRKKRGSQQQEVVSVLRTVPWIGKAISNYLLSGVNFILGQFANLVTRSVWQKDTFIARKGDPINSVYFILAGVASKQRGHTFDANREMQNLVCSDVFGETALISEFDVLIESNQKVDDIDTLIENVKVTKRDKTEPDKWDFDVVAKSKVFTFEISIDTFVKILTNSKYIMESNEDAYLLTKNAILYSLHTYNRRFSDPAWKVLCKNKALHQIIEQQDCVHEFLNMMRHVKKEKGDKLFEERTNQEQVYIIEKGTVECSLDCGVSTFRGSMKQYSIPPTLSECAFIGDINSILKNDNSDLDCTVISKELTAYMIRKSDWMFLIEKYPGMTFQFLDKFHIM